VNSAQSKHMLTKVHPAVRSVEGIENMLPVEQEKKKVDRLLWSAATRPGYYTHLDSACAALSGARQNRTGFQRRDACNIQDKSPHSIS
jgi:hypothetical protein